jgi:hypothetical protein
MKIPMRTSIKLAAFAGLAAAGAIVYGALSVTPSAQPFAHVPSVAVSGFDLSSGKQVEFQSWFDPVVWRGEIVAYNLDTGGAPQVPAKWLASERLKAQNWDSGRRIITRNGTTNVTFRWADLSAAQQSALGDATTGPKVLNFVRGDRSNEQEFKQLGSDGKTVTVLSGSATGIFRARASVLGDIIHSKPVYVGAPPANYSFDNYIGFKTANAARTPRVYVGSNDGMVHAFDAATGDEVFAYVPSMLVPKLKALSATAYDHTYYVDGAIAVGDAYLGSAWKTVLVGALGAGGKGLYALDVTDPAAADETAAKAKIMWEITNATAGFEELGLTYAEPVIAKLSTGKWAAIVGNGYSDATAQTGTGKAVLYVIDLQTGALISAIDTGSGSTSARNGLSSASVIDTDGDGGVDTVYAGDLEGQMWKFDLSSKTSSSWSGSVLYKTDPARPIVGAPDVASHPLGGFLVYFATGAVFTADHAIDDKVQNHAYAIWDGAPAANNALLDQTLTEKTVDSPTGAKQVRVSSGLSINWANAAATLHKGWRTALPPGEHVLGNGFVRDGRYHFTSVNPTVRNALAPHGASWLMELDYLNGGTNGSLVFNVNDDTVIDEKDAVAGETGNTRVPVGVYLGAGLWSQPVLALVNSGASTTLFNNNTLASPGDVPGPPTTPTTTGIRGGHFDYDFYNTANSTTDKHVHMYDDVYNVTGASFTASSDSDFNLTADGRVTSSSEFFVLVSNGDLSPGVNITVGGKTWKAYEFPNTFDGTQTYYNATTAKKFQFQMPDNVLDAKDWGTGVIRAGLHPTAPECVIYDPTLNIGGRTEIHNGALTIWVLKKSTPKSAIVLNVVGNPAKGYKVTNDSYVLKKWTVFWHNGKMGIDTAPCYGEAGWSMYPPIDPDADTQGASSQVRAPGSEDPSGLPQYTLTSNNVTFIKSATYNGKTDYSGTYTIVNTYGDGTVVTTTTVVDKYKNVVSTKTSTVAGTSGSTGPGSSTVPQVQTVTKPTQGWDQARDGGKLGRIAWREVIRD